MNPSSRATRPSAGVAEITAIEETLYEIRRKIYPRAVTGSFATWRWIFVFLTQLIYYGLPWLSWNGRQAVLFDLAHRKFYILGLVFWPQDIVYLTVLLIISAYSLFLFTAVAGRLWCGYACPQTVYTEIFLWIERKVEGDRSARMKLDQGVTTARKLRLKLIKHTLWIVLALWTGFTFVGYFTPIKTLGTEVMAATLGPWESFWILFYGFATYGNAGWMREQVCKYMCPYARFQGVMFDPDTLTITYDRHRGEPRGGRSKKVDAKAKGLGDCVDCGICVQVCPTGIDIRKGLQYECIGCGACIDGCNQVMEKMAYPKGLIRYGTENAMARGYSQSQMLRHMLRPRILIYLSILLLIIVAASYSLGERVPVKVNVLRDRGNVSHESKEGDVENVYRLKIMNTQEMARSFRIRVSGMEGLELESESQPIMVGPATDRVVPVRVESHGTHLSAGSHLIRFVVESVDAGADRTPIVIVERASFVVP